MDQCCQSLVDEKQYPSDAWLKIYVGARSLAERIIAAFSRDDHEDSDFRNEAMLETIVRTFRQELARMEADVASPAIQGSGMCFQTSSKSHSQRLTFVNHLESLSLELKFLSISIHEVALYAHMPPSSRFSASHTSRLLTLLSSSRALIIAFLSTPSPVAEHFTLSTFSMVWYGYVVLSKLALLPSSPGWDRSVAQKEANFVELARRAKDKAAALSRTVKDSGVAEKDIWSGFVSTIDGMLSWYKKQCDVQTGGEDTGMEGSAGMQGPHPNPSDSVGELLIQYKSLGVPQQQGCGGCGDCGDIGNHGTAAESVQTPNGDHRCEGLEEVPSNLWDDLAWQNILNEYSFIPPTPLVGYSEGSFAPYGYPWQ